MNTVVIVDMQRLGHDAVLAQPFGDHVGQFGFAGTRFTRDSDHEFLFFTLQDLLDDGFTGIPVFIFD
jgi:hypothetical protein